jgi:antitoxin Phd
MSTESPAGEPDLRRPFPVDVSFRASELTIDVSVSHARAHLPELLDGVRDGAVVYLTRYGRRLAALVPAAAGEYLERAEDEYWGKRAAEATQSDEPSVPWEQVVAEMEVAEKDVAESDVVGMEVVGMEVADNR